MSSKQLPRPTWRSGWLGPFVPPRAVRRRTLVLALWLGDVSRGRARWILWSLAAGVGPLSAGYLLGWPVQHFLSGALLAPLVIGCAARNRARAGLCAMALAFTAHSALAMNLAFRDPDGFAVIMPDGADYWTRSHYWIMTGEKPEYDASWWLPHHGRLLLGSSFFSYSSLGHVTLWHGFYEADLMNFYVGRLIAHSRNPLLALAVGWHPWSVARGLGYIILTFEVVSLSLARFTGRRISPARDRRRRWLAGLALLLCDVAIKACCTGLARETLFANLL